MQERILVPLDGTEVGEAVLPKVEDLILKTSPRMEAEVTLIQVISKMNFNFLHKEDAAQLPAGEDELQERKSEAMAYLEKAAEKMRARGIAINTMVSLGEAAAEIVKAAHSIDAHLIAMSTHGRSGVIRWAIGSVTDSVIRLEGKIPVMAVNASQKDVESSVLPMQSLQSLIKHT